MSTKQIFLLGVTLISGWSHAFASPDETADNNIPLQEAEQEQPEVDSAVIEVRAAEHLDSVVQVYHDMMNAVQLIDQNIANIGGRPSQQDLPAEPSALEQLADVAIDDLFGQLNARMDAVNAMNQRIGSIHMGSFRF